ncbi:MAG: hypothetical protein B6D46_11085, partial [Polyangiaceae bacterium UTPRO1]
MNATAARRTIMRTIIALLAGVSLVTGSAAGALAFGHAGGGSWSHTGYRGSTVSGGGGSWNAQGFRGGSASGGGGSWSGQGFRDSTAYGGGGAWNAQGFRG